MTRDERRREAAARRLTMHIERIRTELVKIAAMTGSDGKPLCRKQFLQIAERHADMAVRYAKSACAPKEKREV